MDAGAVDIIQKPRLGTKRFLEEARVTLCDAAKADSMVRIKRHAPLQAIQPKLNANVIIEKGKGYIYETTDKIIAIGASTVCSA